MTETRDPAELGATLLEAINGDDLESVVECYAADATLELPDGTTVTGHDGIRAFYAELLASRPHFELGEQAPALIYADIALTTTRVGETATAEVARRQPTAPGAGSWTAPTCCSIAREWHQPSPFHGRAVGPPERFVPSDDRLPARSA